MTIKKSISLISLCFILSLIVSLIFIIFIDPKEAGIFGLVVFLAAVFLATLSFFTLIFIILKIRWMKDKERIFENFFPSFRRAIFIAFFLIGLVLLNRFKLLEWWSYGILLLVIILLETIFSLKKKKIIYLESKNVSGDSTN